MPVLIRLTSRSLFRKMINTFLRSSNPIPKSVNMIQDLGRQIRRITRSRPRQQCLDEPGRLWHQTIQNKTDLRVITAQRNPLSTSKDSLNKRNSLNKTTSPPEKISKWTRTSRMQLGILGRVFRAVIRMWRRSIT